MKCVNADCSVVEHESDCCPVCRRDGEGEHFPIDSFEDECDAQAAELYEDMAHGGKKDDWHESHMNSLHGDPIEYRDNGEPIGYC